jgi:hypothetical protein
VLDSNKAHWVGDGRVLKEEVIFNSLFICMRHVTLLLQDSITLLLNGISMMAHPSELRYSIIHTLDEASVSSDLAGSNFDSASSSFRRALASEPGNLSSMNRLGGTIDHSPTARMTGRYSKQANMGSFVAGPFRYPTMSANPSPQGNINRRTCC